MLSASWSRLFLVSGGNRPPPYVCYHAPTRSKTPTMRVFGDPAQCFCRIKHSVWPCLCFRRALLDAGICAQWGRTGLFLRWGTRRPYRELRCPPPARFVNQAPKISICFRRSVALSLLGVNVLLFCFVCGIPCDKVFVVCMVLLRPRASCLVIVQIDKFPSPLSLARCVLRGTRHRWLRKRGRTWRGCSTGATTPPLRLHQRCVFLSSSALQIKAQIRHRLVAAFTLCFFQ